MNPVLRVAVKSDLKILEANTPSFSEINYIQIDLHKLIDNHKSVIETIDENKNKLSFDELIIICDWLYQWYKKNDNYILSNRILDSFRYTLSVANYKRENNS